MATGFSLGASGGGAGNAKAVRLFSKENKKLGVFTYGHASPGVMLQSIGGGGGNGSLVQNVSRSNSNEFSLGASVSKGGRGGSGGNSGAVAVDLQNLVIATEGANSSGLQAQTIGGGGGNAGSVNAKTGKGDYQISLALGANGGKEDLQVTLQLISKMQLLQRKVHHPVPFKSKPSAVEVATLAM